ncbi:MAG: hypothetical protein JJU20_10405 [Opitutales bacterium]|nr:hypothetical protein [Opitutales bacterium]
MKLSGTKLRENVYRVLDEALDTGKSVEIQRKGRTLRIVPDKPGSRLESLRKRPTLRGNPEDLLSLDWSSEWKP